MWYRSALDDPCAEMMHGRMMFLSDPFLLDKCTYGVDGDNLTGGLLHLTELTNEVPEAGLGDRLVDGKDPHAVELGRGLLLGRKVASNHHVLSEASHLEDC